MSSPPAPESATLTIDQLCLSRLNVRTNAADASATAALEASILAEGVLQSISVHPLKGNLRMWGVFAGGRRYRSIRNLVDRGAVPKDFPIPVLIHDAPDAEIVARSLAENMLRRDLRSYETFAGVVRERNLGHSAEQIAQRHGQELSWVRRALRLGELAKPVFEAYAAGTISTEQAQAFGATADHELQLAAFTALMVGPEHVRTPHAIRTWLGVDDRDTAKLLRFAGDEYRAAGGAFEPDLFADGMDESGRVTDIKQLRKSADDKVQALRIATRERVGRADLRYVPARPTGQYGGPDWALHVLLEDGAELPAGDIVCHIEIGEDGVPDVTFWWASRKARDGDAKPARAAPVRSPAAIKSGAAIGQQSDDSRQKADALIREEAGLTRDGIEAMRSIRRSILRAALVQDAREGRVLGRDLLVFAQARMLLSIDTTYPPRESDVGVKRLGSSEPDGDAARAQIDASEAGKAWAKAIRELKAESFLAEPDHAAALLDFRNAPQAVRDMTAAVVAGIALERSLDADGYRVPLHDALAVQARVAHPQGIRHWWQPTAAFLKLLPRAEQLAIAEPFVERAVFGTWQRLKVDELTPHVLKVVTGAATSVRRSLAIAAAQWVHPLLQFRTDAGTGAASLQSDELEAAE